ncbi:hypothetical protein OC846_000221 [Tilletia horrida]|uniref:Peptidase A1 domain-containing protein n=1 Tax=Tilletia horrida TaxID=155126 RepID=A0AAN6GWD8_9BASI|nr:hypothetical protein OC846_000221 [Tilletia horrida]
MRISASLLVASHTAFAALAASAAVSRNEAGTSSNQGDIAQPFARRTAPGRGISMPIYRRTSSVDRTPEVVLQEARRQKQRIRNRYGAKSKKRQWKQEDQKRGTTALVDFGADSFYFAQVNIGTPAQTFDITLDTGSSDFWVVDSECTSSACAGALSFNEGASNTLIRSNAPWSIQYGKGAAQGTLAADTVSLAGYTVMNSTFALATQVADVLNPPISGLMGMAWKSLSTTGATPFWQAVVEGGNVAAQVFSFQLARNNDADNLYTSELPLNPGGVFTLGELDSNQYQGSITWHTVPQRFIQNAGYWAIAIQSMTIQGRTASLNGQYAVIDTGTTLIAAPPNLVAAFYGQIANSQPIDGGFWVYPCTTSVKLALTFDGSTYNINPEDFNFGSAGQGYCVGSLFEEDLGANAPSVIAGDTFLKNVFSAYRYNPPSVGFAALKNGEAQTLPIPSGATQTGSGGVSTTRTDSATLTSAGIPTNTRTGNTDPTGLAGGSGLPDPSVVSGSAPVTGTIAPSSSSNGNSNAASTLALRSPAGAWVAGSTAVLAAMLAGVGALFL